MKMKNNNSTALALAILVLFAGAWLTWKIGNSPLIGFVFLLIAILISGRLITKMGEGEKTEDEDTEVNEDNEDNEFSPENTVAENASSKEMQDQSLSTPFKIANYISALIIWNRMAPVLQENLRIFSWMLARHNSEALHKFTKLAEEKSDTHKLILNCMDEAVNNPYVPDEDLKTVKDFVSDLRIPVIWNIELCLRTGTNSAQTAEIAEKYLSLFKDEEQRQNCKEIITLSVLEMKLIEDSVLKGLLTLNFQDKEKYGQAICEIIGYLTKDNPKTNYQVLAWLSAILALIIPGFKKPIWDQSATKFGNTPGYDPEAATTILNKNAEFNNDLKKSLYALFYYVVYFNSNNDLTKFFKITTLMGISEFEAKDLWKSEIEKLIPTALLSPYSENDIKRFLTLSEGAKELPDEKLYENLGYITAQAEYFRYALKRSLKGQNT